MADSLAPHLDDLTRRFKNKIRDLEVEGTCKRRYVRVEKLKQWLEGRDDGHVATRIEELLEVAYRSRSRGQPGLPIQAAEVRDPNNCSLLVFSILLELDRGNFIDRFCELELVDRRLPIDLSSLKTQLVQNNIPEGDVIAEQFDQRQWRFFPATFELSRKKNYLQHYIIPISKKEKINDKGGTARIWQIEVLEEFVGKSLRLAVPTSRFTDPKDDLGHRYLFALKTFDEGHRAEFENEVKAFQALQNQKRMIQYLGAYEHKDSRTGRLSHNILLEFGEADLDEFFFDENSLPPVLSAEIHGFWKELFEVAKAIKDIHLIERKVGEVGQEYYGWHADIKPDNILRVRGKFKLADPGFAKFEKQEGFERFEKRDQKTMVRGGTTTYGAPECHQQQVAVPRSIDIWSLGCVFSLAASWVVLGPQGILQFARLRERAIRKLVGQAPSSRSPISVPGDFFHNGKDVLQDVSHWHNHLRRSLRKSDNVTASVLDLVDQDMLRGDAKKRVGAADLCGKLDLILAKSADAQQDLLPQSLREALKEMNESAQLEPPPPKPIPTATPGLLGVDALQDKKERKSRLYDQPLIPTSHRSEALQGEPASSNDHMQFPETMSGHLPEHYPPRAEQSPTNASGPRSSIIMSQRSPPLIVSHYETQQWAAGHSAPQRTGTALGSMLPEPESVTYVKQNVWQARAEIERRKANSLLRRAGKDSLMSQYFIKRDIRFLVDNAGTMAEHWDEATYLLETLVLKANHQDEDGMDLSFAHGTVNFKSTNDYKSFKKAMEDQRVKPITHVRTDIRVSLDGILFDYLQNTRNRRSKDIRKLTVIILTDGKWDGMSDKNGVENTIITFAQKLGELQGGSIMMRQVSFEFIQFGTDEDAACRLQRLDDELPYAGVPDIVDTEHSRGDVKKMLLGSFVEDYDNKNENTIRLPTNAISAGSYFDPPLRTRDSTMSPEPNIRPTQSPPELEGHIPRMGELSRRETAQTGRYSTPSQQYPDYHAPHHARDGSGGYGRPQRQFQG